jgi:nucleotide-binding universal stress UspA family protein
MSAFDLLIHLRRCEDGSPSGEVGLRLAARLGAHALGLHVVALSPVAFATPEAVALHANETSHLIDDARARAPWWRSQLDRHGVHGEFQVVQGDAVEALCHAARWSDLVVVERPVLNPDAPTGWGIVSRTVFGSSAPVVVVPEAARVANVGTHIVVAWNGSREAMLAIHGALPLLERASRVSVLEGEVAPNPFGSSYLPSIDLRAWLARRGIEATFQVFRPDKEHGRAVLDAAHALDADLIVIGAWGHSRITELVLGGVTRHLFQNSDLPLLVAH